MPYLGVSVLDLQHDVFYLVYFAVTIALLAAYVRVEHVDVAEVFRRRWQWSLGIGVVLAVFLVFNVFNTERATARPHGVYFVFELLWRGVGYGLIDTLLLTVFPCLVAYQLLHGHVGGLKGKLRFTALTLPLVIIVTATYHLGYPQYRQDGLSRPETGNVLISIPTFATANPVGSIVAHVSQHVAAVTHALRVEDLQPTGDEGMTTTAPKTGRRAKPLLGLRRQPGRLALAVMRLPRPLYHRGWGRLLGHTFLLVTHQGRKTGRRRETVAMALTYDPDTKEAVVCSAWGPNTEWVRNLRAHPALEIQIGRETFVPTQHFLSEDEASPSASSSGTAIPGDCASSPRSSAGAISAPTPRCGTSFAAAHSCRSGRARRRVRIRSLERV